MDINYSFVTPGGADGFKDQYLRNNKTGGQKVRKEMKVEGFLADTRQVINFCSPITILEYIANFK